MLSGAGFGIALVAALATALVVSVISFRPSNQRENRTRRSAPAWRRLPPLLTEQPSFGIREGLALPLLASGMAASAIILGGFAGSALLLIIVVAPSILKAPIRVFLALMATWPLVTRYFSIGLPAPLPDIRYERVLVVGLVAFLLGMALRRRKRLPGLGFWASVYLALQLAATVRSLLGFSYAPANLSVLLNATILPIAVFWLAKVLVRDEPTRTKVLLSVGFACLMVAFTGFYERLIGAQASPFPVETGTASGLRYLGVPGGRAAGIVGNPAIYGLLMGFGLLIALSLWPLAKSVALRLLLGSGAVLFAYAVLVSFTRSAWLSIAVGALVAGALSQLYLRSATLVGSMLVSALALVLIFSPTVILDNEVVQDRVLESSNVVGRSDRAVYSWEKFAERPVFGWGQGALDALIAQEFPAGGFDSSHNTFLTLMVDFGLVVTLAYLGLVLGWGARLIERMKQTPRASADRAFLAAMAGMITAYLVSGLFLEMKWFGYTNAVLWLAAGLIEGTATLDGVAGSTHRSRSEVTQ